MTYLYPLVLYTGLGGGLVLLGIASIPRLRFLLKPVTAVWLTALVFLWLTIPREGRWVLSVWSPGAVLGGQILLDMTPTVWWLSLVLALAFTGAAWMDVGLHRDTSPATGPLLLAILILSWLTLASGSLLTMLATWAMFDLVWGIAGLVSGADGERVVFGLAMHGIASLILWVVSLFLLQAGVSELWWLMWPSAPMQVLLLVAAFMRIGFYPFQIVVPQRPGPARILDIIYWLGPITGIALFYRLLMLPGLEAIPAWCTVWGILSMLWCAVMAWRGHRQPSMMDANHALFVGLVAGAGAIGNEAQLLRLVGLWFAGTTLLMFARGRDAKAMGWTWPLWVVVLLSLGVPPSPVGQLYWTLFEVLPWGLRLVLFLASLICGAVFFHFAAKPAPGANTPPRMWQRMSLGAGLGLGLLALFSGVIPFDAAAFSWRGFGLWLMTVLGATAVARWARPVRDRLRYIQPVLEFADLQWLYRSLWRGSEHLLSVLRVSAEVVEGSGSLLWSLLILLLILLVVSSQ